MRNFSAIADGSFDLVFHPVSNLFVSEVRPVWREAFRGPRRGGTLLAGFLNPEVYIFDLDIADTTGELRVKYELPYAATTSVGEEELKRQLERGDTLESSHKLENQIGGQTETGFLIS